jgi:molybdopterin-binding protein
VTHVTEFRISEAAELLGVSADTVRRWVDGGRLPAERDVHGHRVIAGAELAAFARSLAAEPDEGSDGSSARNRLRGIVTSVVKDTVMAQVDIQAGPFRIVSLMSREAVDEMGLQVGAVAIAVIKSTTVVVEKPSSGGARPAVGAVKPAAVGAVRPAAVGTVRPAAVGAVKASGGGGVQGRDT